MNMQIIINQNAMQSNSNILLMSPFQQNVVAFSTGVSQTMPKTASAIPRKGVLGWAVLVQKLWTLLDEVISVGRRIGLMTVRYQPRFLALVTRVAGDLGYTTPPRRTSSFHSPPAFPLPWRRRLPGTSVWRIRPDASSETDASMLR